MVPIFFGIILFSSIKPSVWVFVGFDCISNDIFIYFGVISIDKMTTQPSIGRLVPLFFSVFMASTTSAIKTYQKFVGLPETGDRVDYSNASEHSRTLIIRHNLPVSDRCPVRSRIGRF